MKRVYIAGKVTGLPFTGVVKKFAQAQSEIEDLGFIAVNPITVVNDSGCDWNKAMKLCINALLECDAIIMLPCWRESKGALLEMNIAINFGMEIMFM